MVQASPSPFSSCWWNAPTGLANNITEEHDRETSGKRGKLQRVTTVLMLMLDIKPYVVLKTQGTFLPYFDITLPLSDMYHFPKAVILLCLNLNTQSWHCAISASRTRCKNKVKILKQIVNARDITWRQSYLALMLTLTHITNYLMYSMSEKGNSLQEQWPYIMTQRKIWHPSCRHMKASLVYVPSISCCQCASWEKAHLTSV